MKQQKLVEVLTFLLKSPVSISTTEMSHVPKKWQVWHLFMVNKFTHGSKAEMEQPGLDLQLAAALLPSLPCGELQNKVLHMSLLNYTRSD